MGYVSDVFYDLPAGFLTHGRGWGVAFSNNTGMCEGDGVSLGVKHIRFTAPVVNQIHLVHSIHSQTDACLLYKVVGGCTGCVYAG